MAARKGHAAVVEILVKAGADVNMVNHAGYKEVLTCTYICKYFVNRISYSMLHV